MEILSTEDSADVSFTSQETETHWLKMADNNRREGKHENGVRFDFTLERWIDKSILSAWVGQVHADLARRVPASAHGARKHWSCFQTMRI
jgi:hypothetical protein